MMIGLTPKAPFVLNKHSARFQGGSQSDFNMACHIYLAESLKQDLCMCVFEIVMNKQKAPDTDFSFHFRCDLRLLMPIYYHGNCKGSLYGGIILVYVLTTFCSRTLLLANTHTHTLPELPHSHTHTPTSSLVHYHTIIHLLPIIGRQPPQ